MKSTRQVVLDFFARHGKSPLPGGDAALDVRYLDTGIIDSLGIVTLIAELETELNIQFTAEDMQSYEFPSVGGLIGILDRLIGANA